MTIALFDDSVHGRESQPSTLWSLGSEERIEDMHLRLGVHTHAGIADRQHDVLTGPNRRVIARIVLIERDVLSFDCQFAAVRHGVAGVYSQVHDDLLDLPRIRFHRAQITARNHDQINVLANDSLQHFQTFTDDQVEIDHLGSEHLLTAESQQLAGERSGPFRSFSNFLRGSA